MAGVSLQNPDSGMTSGSVNANVNSLPFQSLLQEAIGKYSRLQPGTAEYQTVLTTCTQRARAATVKMQAGSGSDTADDPRKSSSQSAAALQDLVLAELVATYADRLYQANDPAEAEVVKSLYGRALEAFITELKHTAAVKARRWDRKLWQDPEEPILEVVKQILLWPEKEEIKQRLEPLEKLHKADPDHAPTVQAIKVLQQRLKNINSELRGLPLLGVSLRSFEGKARLSSFLGTAFSNLFLHLAEHIAQMTGSVIAEVFGSGSIHEGSQELTLSGGSFKAEYSERRIQIEGAGPSGYAHRTILRSISQPQQGTISTPAKTTVPRHASADVSILKKRTGPMLEVRSEDGATFERDADASKRRIEQRSGLPHSKAETGADDDRSEVPNEAAEQIRQAAEQRAIAVFIAAGLSDSELSLFADLLVGRQQSEIAEKAGIHPANIGRRKQKMCEGLMKMLIAQNLGYEEFAELLRLIDLPRVQQAVAEHNATTKAKKHQNKSVGKRRK